MVTLRKAVQADMEWVNEQYKSIDYPLSHLDNEIIAIAEKNGKRIGLGRLVKFDQDHGELGGLYVLKEHRKQGICRKLIEFLVPFMKKYKQVYLMTYQPELVSFYEKFGFTKIEDESRVLPSYREKQLDCESRYKKKVYLYVRES